MAEPEDTILDNAVNQPKSASNDSTSAEQHSIPDQIAADRYKLAKAARSRGLGVRYVKLRPGDAVG